MSKIHINNTNIIIRPSSLDTFLGCGYQWARVFLTGETSIPNSRAVIGTGIHKGAEHLWAQAMETEDVESINMTAVEDAAVEGFKKEVENYGIAYGDGETENSAITEIIHGINAFHEDVVPFTPIPDFVEKRFTIKISDHQVVSALSGTIDYQRGKTIGDIKTSKRKSTPSNHEVQQSTYKMLAEANGLQIDSLLIQNVVLTKEPYGQILSLEPNIPKVKTIVNNLLDTLDLLAEDKIRPEILFRGNPKYTFCSEKFCKFYNDCMFVKGEEPEQKSAQVVKL